jgi:hypothetical protein
MDYWWVTSLYLPSSRWRAGHIVIYKDARKLETSATERMRILLLLPHYVVYVYIAHVQCRHVAWSQLPPPA